MNSFALLRCILRQSVSQLIGHLGEHRCSGVRGNLRIMAKVSARSTNTAMTTTTSTGIVENLSVYF